MKSNNKLKITFIERLFNVLSGCSLACLFRLAKAFSWLIAYSKNRISKQTRLSVTLCIDEPRRRSFYRQSIHHTTCSLIEMASIWHQPIDRVLGYIQSETVCLKYKADDGAKIIVAPHFGSWEILTYWLAQQNNVYALYKPSRSKALDDYILSKRTRNGAVLVPTNLVGLRALLKGLKAGATVMILPDQKPSKDSAKINAKFYGHEASTSLLINSLTKKIKCSVYIAAAIRNLKEANYHVHLNKLNEVICASDEQQSADYLNASIEAFIKIDEAQYQWSYRRFSKQTYLKANDNTST